MSAGDVKNANCDLLSSATLVTLLKIAEAEMAVLRDKQGDAYRQPQRSLGMGSAIPKLAANCVRVIVQQAVGMAT